MPLVAVGITYRAIQRLFLEPASPSDTSAITVDVTSDKSFKELAQELEQRGLVRTSLSLRVIARLQKIDKELKAGEYALSPSMTPEEILAKIVRGETVLRRATVREGLRSSEIGALFEAAGITAKADFDQALADRSLAEELGIPAPSLEGYLFPDTYSFPRNTPARKIIAAMKAQFDSHWGAEWSARAQELGRTRHEIVTLASIIEKESGSAEEQPRIASVFYNRLRVGMRLQSDPTVIYGITNFNGNLTKADLLAPTPYNTYVIDGLPPGPIANPGLSALTAALYPETTGLFFFVGNGMGRHVFSANLDDHNRAVDQFQRGGAQPSHGAAPGTQPTP